MADKHPFRDLLHRATHRIPGVPAHVEQPAGHHGKTHRNRAWRASAVHHRSQNHSWNHSPARPPRVLAAWQRRIGAFFGQEL
ncbi:MAG: hypothetical protein ACRDP6_12210 [Actinoallomurus sp.]